MIVDHSSLEDVSWWLGLLPEDRARVLRLAGDGLLRAPHTDPEPVQALAKRVCTGWRA